MSVPSFLLTPSLAAVPAALVGLGTPHPTTYWRAR
jgi:hypothetical protein